MKKLISILLTLTFLCLSFSSVQSIQTEQNQIRLLDLTGSIDIIINFAGNYSDLGGPYWQPPGETIKLDDKWEHGYYTNDSYQSEDWIYINVSVISYDSPIEEVWLHWYDKTIDKWFNNSHQLISTNGGFYEINTKNNISTHNNHKYSFDIFANDSIGNSTIESWEKIGLNGEKTRRYVNLNCTEKDINYIPFYFSSPPPYLGSSSHKPYDRMHHDQHQGTSYDTGYLSLTIPSKKVSLRTCGWFLKYWFNGNVCNKHFTLDNIYLHFWKKNSKNETNHEKELIGWGKSRSSIESIDIYNKSNNVNRSCIDYIDREEPFFNGKYYLETKLLNTTSTFFSDNNIYEFYFYYSSYLPVIISNRSFQSFILFNVPDNETLNESFYDSDNDGLSDWTELYRTYTNPFLADTDNDGHSDFKEKNRGSDPNDYTDLIDTNYIYVDDDNTQGPWYGTIDYPYMDVQDGIDNASNGDTVFVFEGEYRTCCLYKSNIKLTGENRKYTIINKADKAYSFVYIHSDNITITNFSIMGGERGVWIDSGSYNSISNNIIKLNDIGISIYDSRNNIITNNLITDNNEKGIFLGMSKRDLIKGNEISNTTQGSGIAIDKVYEISIKRNNIKNNKIGLKTFYPSFLSFQKQNRVTNNNFVNNTIHAGDKYGFSLLYTRFCHNYWGRPRLFPKMIISLGNMDASSFIPGNIDFFPALKPYELDNEYK